MTKFLKIILSFLLIASALFFLLWLTPSHSIEISDNSQSTLKDKISLFNPFKSFSKSSSAINLLALGRPGDNYPGGDLTDTILLIHLRPEEKKAVLISLPRDFLVELPEGNGFTKINSLYQSAGIESLKQKVQEITGLSIDYYLIIDLTVVKEVINLVDGLNIYVPQDINDPFFPGPNYSYQAFTLKAGWRYLDGDQVLKYVRTRYTSPNGDFDRMARQQQVIKLIKQKVLSLNPLFDFVTYLKIFNTLSDHIKTDAGVTKMKFFWQTAKEVDAQNINYLVIDKKNTDLLASGQVIFGSQLASVVWPKRGQSDYTDIREHILQTIEK